MGLDQEPSIWDIYLQFTEEELKEAEANLERQIEIGLRITIGFILWNEEKMMNNLLRIALVPAVLGVFAMWTPGAPEVEKLPDGRGGVFDVTLHNIPLKEIEAGGPPKDGIPALTDPSFVSAKEANKFLQSWDRVLGVEHRGVAKAYPIKILDWHEVVNDTIADRPLAVSW